MPVKDEVWVIDDSSILTVDDKKAQRKRAKVAQRVDMGRPSPQGEQAVFIARSAGSIGSTRPLVAAGISVLVCGSGQAYNGQRQLGLLFFVVEAMLLSFHWSATAMWGFLQEMGYIFEVSEEAMLVSVAGIDAFLALFVLFNISHAWQVASQQSGSFEGFGRPWVSASASALVPGLGQLCNAQLGKALAFFSFLLAGGLAASALLLLPFSQYLDRINLVGRLSSQATQILAGTLFVAVVVWGFSIYDAMVVARYRRRGR